MMHDALTPEIVIDRALTVQMLSSQGCSSKALERCHHLIAYLTSTKFVDEQTFKVLGSIPFLPVLQIPSYWPFECYADGL